MRWPQLVSALNSRVSGPGLSPGWGHCVVFLGKTLHSHSASPPRGINGYRQIVGENLTNCGEVTCARWTSIPSRGYRNRDKHRQLCSLGSKASLLEQEVC